MQAPIHPWARTFRIYWGMASTGSIWKLNLVPDGKRARIVFVIALAFIPAALAAFTGYFVGFSLLSPAGHNPVAGAVKMGSLVFGICIFMGWFSLRFDYSRARSLFALRKALAKKDSLARASAAYEIGCMGADAVAALGDLRAMSTDRDDTVQFWVRWAIERISGTHR